MIGQDYHVNETTNKCADKMMSIKYNMAWKILYQNNYRNIMFIWNETYKFMNIIHSRLKSKVYVK